MDNTPENIPQRQAGHGRGWTVAVIILVLVLGAIVYFGRNKSLNDNQNASQDKQAQTDNGDEMPGDNISGMEGGAMPDSSPIASSSQPSVNSNEVKVFKVEGSNFAFSVKEIRVKKGDKVRVVFTNAGGFHDWVIDEFSAHTPRISDGQSATVEFIADKAGIFEYYCSVGEHRAMGMKGNLIVEE